MRVQKKRVRLYHISDENQDGKIFKPRIPETICDDEKYENQKIKRICFASSMSGAYRAICYPGYVDRMYVHVPVDIDKIIARGRLVKPSEDEVYDVHDTGEYWIKCPVKLKCIGLAEFMSMENYPDMDNVRIKWLEKY